MGKAIDMTSWNMWEHGVPDSRLTVINRTDNYVSPNGTQYAMWNCMCQCGNNIDARGDHLRDGSILSCGCYQREKTHTAHKKYNIYELNLQDEYGLYGIGYTTNTNEPFYFDMEDYHLIKDYCWSKHRSSKTYCYIATKIDNKSIRLHQIIGCKNHDHIDQNPYNNRKYNLRMATQSQNAFNKKLPANNTSQIIGVRQTESGSWNSRLTKDGNLVFNKTFKTKDEAIIARLKKEMIFCGEFAPQKHMFEEYGIYANQEVNNEL